MIDEREAFGARLRRERERRCITLESIADETKIKRSLLADLERGDVSRWPHGIFRRSFVRDYAAAIGLDRAETLATFLTVFPDPHESPAAPGTPAPGTPAPGTLAPGTPAPGTLAPGTAAPGTLAPAASVPGTPAPGTPAPGTVAPCTPVPEGSDLRLTLAGDASIPVRGTPARIVAALAEVAIVVLVAGIAALVDAAAFSTAAVAAALAWSIGSTLVWGRNPVLAWLETDGRQLAFNEPATHAELGDARLAAITVRDGVQDTVQDHDDADEHHVSDRVVRVRPIRPALRPAQGQVPPRVVPQRREDVRQRARRSRA